MERPDDMTDETKPTTERLRLAPNIEEAIIITLAAIREAARTVSGAASEWRKVAERHGR